MNKQYDVCVIGGGAAGMSSALGAVKNGAKKVLLVERDIELGGILQQCIHNGFGLHHFHEELTGPAYAERLKTELLETNVEIKLETTVLEITKDKTVHLMNKVDGYQIIEAKSIVVAIGCRERTRHQIGIPGKRFNGIMTAGLAQRYLNIDGYLVGKNVFILGSGDIGLIMARRMRLEGANVLGVAELMPYSNGLNRNIVQCLHDYNIPLYLSHTVTGVSGKDRLEKVTISEVDENFQVKEGTSKTFEVDTLLLSVGLIPENKLLTDIQVEVNPITNGAYVDDQFQTNIPGIFACGNSLHVHDLVDFVAEESFESGKNAAKYALNQENNHISIPVKPASNVRYVIPNKIKISDDEVTFKFRVTKPMNKGLIIVKQGDSVIKEIKKSHLLPAEMESVKLNKSLFKPNSQDEIFVEVKGVE
ncbi:FAD-dependent oxidoreductase [Mycoplasmatota bacterium]|nr:FAD-dependent oxidoreductase [Mycoplasmatota bacterium]